MRRGLVPLLLTLIVVAVAAPVVWPLTALSRAGYDPDDAYLFMWNFWWTGEALSDTRNPYWTDEVLYPLGASLTLHSYPLPYSLLSLPVQYVLPGTLGRIVAFNVIVVLSFVLSAAGAYFLALRLTASRQASLVAGVIFATMPFRLLNVPRLHVLSTECLAWSVLAWLRFADAPTRPRTILLAVCLAVTWYTSPEYALATGFFIVMWTLVHWRSCAVLRSRAFARQSAIAGVICLGLAGPLLVGQAMAVLHGDVIPSRALGEVVAWSPALTSFVTPSRLHPVYGDLFASAGEYGTPGVAGMRSETTIGFVVLALAGIGAATARARAARFWIAAAGLFLLLTLGPFLRLTGTILTSIPLPYLVAYLVVPPFRAMRDPTRLLPMAMLMMSVLAAFGFAACLRRVRTNVAGVGVSAAVVAALLFESWMPKPFKLAAEELVPGSYARLATLSHPGAVIDLTGDERALLAQTVHLRPITGGRLAIPRAASAGTMLPVERALRDPEAILALPPDERAARVAADRRMLERLGIGFVVAPAETPSLNAVADLLNLVAVARDQIVIYQVMPVASRATPIP